MILITKTKIYVKNPSEAPKGVKVETGKRGGLYYESSEQSKIKLNNLDEVKYESNINFISGKLPTFNSLPNLIYIPKNNIELMEKTKNESDIKNIEISYGIEIKDNYFILDTSTRVEGDSGSINPIKGKLGFYHTHPHSGMGSFSMSDLNSMTLSNKSKSRIIIAQNTPHGSIWMAMSTSDTFKMNEQDLKKIYQQHYVDSIRKTGNAYRLCVKSFCNKIKVKLYYGKNYDTLEEYNENL